MSVAINAPGKLNSIQVLRGVAALLVVVFHLDAMFREGAPRSQEMGAFWARGFAGVDMFFVISGFIMVYVTRDIAPSLANALKFLRARLTRIYPLWWVYALLMMAYFMTAFGQPAAPDKAAGDAVLPYVLKSLFLLPQSHDPVLGVGWTLIHEMLFYVLFAAGLLLPRKFLLVWLLVWAALIAGVAALGPQPIHAKNLPQLVISPINLEFILGAWVALYLTRNSGRSGALFLWAGLALFAAALWIHPPANKHKFNWVRVLVYGVPSAMILLGIVWLEGQKPLRFPRIFKALGDWSYSLYLSHLLVLLALKRIWIYAGAYLPEPLKWGADGWIDNGLYITIGLTGAIIMAAISYHVIEKPSLRLLRGKREA